LLSVPLNVQVVTALEEEPRSLTELRRAVGSPPQTTMRGHLKKLSELQILGRNRSNSFPGTVDYEIFPAGRSLLAVAAILDTWLERSPDSALRLGTPAAKSAIKAMVEAWSGQLIRALAARPFSLTELDRLITTLNYPTLERRLSAMRLVGQIESCAGPGRVRRYEMTEWLRQAIAPLAAAARWERKHTPGTTPPIGRSDIESVLLLAVPMIRLNSEVSGTCRLVFHLGRSGDDAGLAGAMVEVRQGEIASCVARLEGDPAATISGTPQAWLGAVIEGDFERLDSSGDGGLGGEVLEGLHGTLFASRQPA
jgi:DNA-binding HxlR family transcriptional regulator